jgi:hypothetical protein
MALIPSHKSLFNQSANNGLPIGNLSSQFFANVYLDALDQFVKHLEANGIHTDAAIRTSGNAPTLRLTYIVDPWGTNIELTEGLTPPRESASR